MRFISQEVSIPVQSRRRKPRPAVIPPISFVGELEVGISGFWNPTSPMSLLQASVASSGAGTSTADLVLLKEEPGVPDPLQLCRFSLPVDGSKQIVNLGGILVDPYDKLFVACFSESLHTGVVIQIVGEMLS